MTAGLGSSSGLIFGKKGEEAMIGLNLLPMTYYLFLERF
jgi:hypothetical protein